MKADKKNIPWGKEGWVWRLWKEKESDFMGDKCLKFDWSAYIMMLGFENK